MINRLLLPLAMALLAGATHVTLAAELKPAATERSRPQTIRTDHTALSRTDPVRAQTWNLSETEWRRYEALMQGIRGSVSPPTISPLEVLGIHARDEAERRRYAERWAQAMLEDAERILAFQRAYREAVHRLYPGVPLIDADRLPATGARRSALQPEDRVLFFTRAGCEACDALLARLLGRLEQIAGVDIYLIDVEPGDDQAVRDWAAAQGIDPAWVRARRVTLDFEAGALAELSDGKGPVPYVMRRRGEALEVLSPGAL